MNEWQPLGVREGSVEAPEEPYEHIEEHMRALIDGWVDDRLDSYGEGTDRAVQLVVTKLRWPTKHRTSDILRVVQDRSADYLTFIDGLLRWSGNPSQGAAGSSVALRERLEFCGSVWTVAPDGLSLARRVEPTAQSQFEEAVHVGDLAAAELARAWTAAYGRTPDASGAWHHAIKAVEHIYVPLVVPSLANMNRGGLAHVIGELKDEKAAGWTTPIGVDPADPDQGVGLIRDMLRALKWNPDRHGGGSSFRPPDQAEAETLVHLAVTLVQWGRQGVLSRKPKS